MAQWYPPSPSSSDSMEEVLRCAVCLETYSDPRVLSCLHSFCLNCLEGLTNFGPSRRYVSCPVCKKVTLIPSDGVIGLPNDFKLEQFREVLMRQSSSPPAVDLNVDKICDSCNTRSSNKVAEVHCVHCALYLCIDCKEKHSSNTQLVSHQIVSLKQTSEAQSDLCQSHKLYPIRYICKPCSLGLCTVCVLEHDAKHSLIETDNDLIERQRKELKDLQKSLTIKFNDILQRDKLTRTLKQQQQTNYKQLQESIQEKCGEMIRSIRDKERLLLSEAAKKIEESLFENVSDSITNIHLEKVSLERLQEEISRLLVSPPYMTLISYSNISQKAKEIIDRNIAKPISKPTSNSGIRFQASTSEIKIGDIVKYQIQDNEMEVCNNDVKPGSKRVKSILSAMSSQNSHDIKMKSKRIKGFHNTEDNNNQLSTISPSNDDDRCTLLLTISEQGGWPGRICEPCAAVFLPSRELVVAEQNRLQVFDAETKQSRRILSWGKIKPAGLALSPTDNKLVISCRKDKCVKVISPINGDILISWGSFGNPVGIYVTSSGHVIVTDTEQCSVSVHLLNDGTILRQIGNWSSGLNKCQLVCPFAVAVNSSNHLIISDSGQDCVKIMNSETGTIQSSFNFTGGPYGQLRRPHGLLCLEDGKILIADRDNHRISVFTEDGKFLKNILTRHNGIKYPMQISLESNTNRLVVVEHYAGILNQKGHFSIKIFNVAGLK